MYYINGMYTCNVVLAHHRELCTYTVYGQASKGAVLYEASLCREGSIQPYIALNLLWLMLQAELDATLFY